MKFTFALITLAILFFGCQNNPAPETPVNEPEEEVEEQQEVTPQPSPQEQILGDWETNRLTVYINTYGGMNRNDTLIVNKAEFPEKLGIKYARGHYYADSTYLDEYIGVNDSVLGSTQGKWQFEGDSLIVIPDDTSGKIYKYYTTFPSPDEISFYGLVDWDLDGQEDDVMNGISTRVTPVP